MPIVCNDPEVRTFLELEVWNLSPYSQPEHVLSGRELFAAARQEFGDYRCSDLVFWLH